MIDHAGRKSYVNAKFIISKTSAIEFSIKFWYFEASNHHFEGNEFILNVMLC